MTNEYTRLRNEVSRIIAARQEHDRISPLWVATEVMQTIDPERSAPVLVYAGCHLEIRQIARSFLREKFEGREDDKASHPLFPDLQSRYPTARSQDNEEREYIREDLMGPDDYAYNIVRMEREVRSKQAHVDALRARMASRFPSVCAA